VYTYIHTRAQTFLLTFLQLLDFSSGGHQLILNIEQSINISLVDHLAMFLLSDSSTFYLLYRHLCYSILTNRDMILILCIKIISK